MDLCACGFALHCGLRARSPRSDNKDDVAGAGLGECYRASGAYAPGCASDEHILALEVKELWGG
jgi:hypothetical protein